MCIRDSNEAESVSYQWATMEEILKNHVTPYGIVCTGYDAVTAAARYLSLIHI